MTKKGEKELSLELVEEAARNFTTRVNEAIKRIETSYPTLIFQEKHTSGHLWWKREWYTYYKYFEGSMVGISQYSYETIKSFEKGK